MRCFKLLGERVMARDFDRQVVELQVRVAILNRLRDWGRLTPFVCPDFLGYGAIAFSNSFVQQSPLKDILGV